jgi:hypothetical protein
MTAPRRLPVLLMGEGLYFPAVILTGSHPASLGEQGCGIETME